LKTVIKYIQLPLAFSAEKLNEELAALSAQWVLHFNKMHYDGEWSAISLRSVNGSIDNIIPDNFTTSQFRDTIFMDQCPYIKSIVAQFPGECRSVRLLKLSPGAVIKEHTDGGLCFEQGEARIHIPITTNPQVAFYLDGERMNLAPGECWYMNFNLPHSIANLGNTDRVHLVMDIVVNDRVSEMFARVEAGQKKMTEAKEAHSITEKQEMIMLLKEMNTIVSLQLAEELETGEQSQ
jgi:quercetin dioxygenase-like cupin family protein